MICPEIPQATGTGGQVRSYHFLTALAQRFRLTLVVLREIPNAQVRETLSGRCHEIITPARNRAERSPGRLTSMLRTLAAILRPQKGHWVGFLDRYLHYYRMSLETASPRIAHKLLLKLLQSELSALVRANPPPATTHYLHRSFNSIQKPIEARVASEHFDLVFVEHTFACPVVYARLPFPDKPLMVCDAHNIESVIHQRLAKTDVLAQRHYQIQARILERWEKRTFERCDVTLVTSEEDKQGAQRLFQSGIYQIAPNGVDVDYFAPRPMLPQPVPRVLFTGTMDYAPNKDAADYFVREIFPYVRNEIPDCQFIIAGRCAEQEFPPASQGGNVVVVSDPEDIRPVFDQANVVIVPLRIGGGTRLKILEALSIGRAVVSTRIGAEGVPYRDGVHLVLADEPTAFAESIVHLLRNPERAQELASSGQHWVRKHYSWQAIREEAVKILADRLA
jgi:glycosyltransferase involved in cell wall biosynthesis